MDAATQESVNLVVFVTSTMLFIDNLYSLKYFHYTYLFELKRRFVMVGKGLPAEHRLFLQAQIKRENGQLRSFIQSAYLPWFVFCFFANLWYLPLIVTGFTGLTNFIYKKPYISPFMLLLNLLLMNCCYVYGVVYLYLMK